MLSKYTILHVKTKLEQKKGKMQKSEKDAEPPWGDGKRAGKSLLERYFILLLLVIILTILNIRNILVLLWDETKILQVCKIFIFWPIIIKIIILSRLFRAHSPSPWGGSCVLWFFALFSPLSSLVVYCSIIYFDFALHAFIFYNFKVIILLTPRLPDWLERGKRCVVGLIR